MSTLSYQNHFSATLASNAGAADTVLQVNISSSVAITVPPDGRIPLTITNDATPIAYEVVYCTNISGTSFTVIRGMEGSSASSWTAGSSIICPPTAGTTALFTQAGWTPPWSAAIATQIGGYSNGAIVPDSNGVQWISTASDNLTQPGVAGASWVRFLAGTSPVGVVDDFAGQTAPDGWIFCYGQAISRTSYAALFAAIGTLYGSGDNSTTFNVPDCRGRTTVGVDNMGGNAAGRITQPVSGIVGTQIGATGGTQLLQGHTHAINDPGHTHFVADPGHVHSITDPGHTHGITDPTHAHGVGDPQHTHAPYDAGHVHTIFSSSLRAFNQQTGSTGGFYSTVGDAPGGQTLITDVAGTGISIDASPTNISIYASGTGIHVNTGTTGISVQLHATGVTINTAVTGVTVVTTGTGASQNVQPSILFNKIIFTGVY
jgi:microcystin-dependent protein